MTHRQLEQLVRKWQARLALTHWRLEVVLDRDRWVGELDEQLGDESPDAVVRFRIRYCEAALHLNPDKAPAWDAREARRHIVHELVHLVLRPLEVTVDALEDLLHRDAWRVFDDSHDRALELTVDELAHRFVELEDQLGGTP